MDCRTARSLLDFARSQSAELHAGEADALDSHLNACPECDALFRQERHIDDHIGRAVRAVPVPPGLRQLILDKLSVERRAQLRRMVVRGGGMAAAAAVLLVAVTWVMGWLGPQTVKISLEEEQVVAQNKRQRADKPEMVVEWFREHHQKTIEVPGDLSGRLLNYNLLSSYHLVMFHGRETPLLSFVKGDKELCVYVLSAKEFDLGDLQSQIPPPPSQGLRTEVVFSPPAPEKPLYAYLLIYPDPDDQGLGPFLVKGGPPG